MKAVGVKELKARLSEYLRAVKAGETLLITERSDVVAELRPVRSRPAAPGSIDDALDALAEAGEVSRPRLTKGSWRWRPKSLGLPEGTAQELQDAMRLDRDEA